MTHCIYLFTQELDGCYYELLTYFISVSHVNSNEKDLSYMYSGEIEFNTTSNQSGHIIEEAVLTLSLNVSLGSCIQVSLNISNSVGNIIFSSQSENRAVCTQRHMHTEKRNDTWNELQKTGCLTKCG